MTDVQLAQRWAAVAGESSATADLGAELLGRWSEPQRRYHTTTHLTACLDAVDDLAAAADDPRAVRLAAWFHDAVHEGRPGADEEASAQFAEQRLPALDLPPALVAEVARLVRLTAGHDPADEDRNGAVLCDADLSVLGGGPDDYAAYAAAVRAEYAHVPVAAFAVGRREVLEALVGRDPIFRTALARDRWEERARRNTSTELLLLG